MSWGRFRRVVVVAGGTLLLSGCTGADADVAVSEEVARDSVLPTIEYAGPIGLDTLATGLVVPWGVAPAPDGRIFVTERPGRIRVVAPDGRLDAEPWAVLDVHHEYFNYGPESGLLGVALSPDFEKDRFVYVFATVWRSTGDRNRSLLRRAWRRAASTFSPLAGTIVKSQVIRFTDAGGRGEQPTVIIDNLPANHYHAGGGLAFGPDGKLYVSVGDVLLPQLAPRAEVAAGKVLRFNADGSVPADNPDPASPVWARGLRNTQAFTWLADGTMLGVEHGPTGMTQESARAGRDELNVLRPGLDYGWPTVVGWQSRDSAQPPIWVWRTAIAPAGLAVLSDDASASASLLVAGLKGGLTRVSLKKAEESGWHADSLQPRPLPGIGRLRSVRRVSPGVFLLTTSNLDARGQRGPHDDLLLRLRILE
jgi:aldose sugar dehydrogenase